MPNTLSNRLALLWPLALIPVAWFMPSQTTQTLPRMMLSMGGFVASLALVHAAREDMHDAQSK